MIIDIKEVGHQFTDRREAVKLFMTDFVIFTPTDDTLPEKLFFSGFLLAPRMGFVVDRHQLVDADLGVLLGGG